MEGARLALPILAITFAILPGVVAIAGLIYGIYIAIREVIFKRRKTLITPQAKVLEEQPLH